MLLLSACKTRVELVSFGLQPVAFSLYRFLSLVVHRGQSVDSTQSCSGGRVNAFELDVNGLSLSTSHFQGCLLNDELELQRRILTEYINIKNQIMIPTSSSIH